MHLDKGIDTSGNQADATVSRTFSSVSVALPHRFESMFQWFQNVATQKLIGMNPSKNPVDSMIPLGAAGRAEMERPER